MFIYGSSDSYKKFDKDSQIETFRKNATLCADYVCEYIQNVTKRPVYPDVKAGYLRPLLPRLPPQQPEPFRTMLQDFHKHIIPGTLHWDHPDMYAYYPHGNAPCNALSDILITAIGGVGSSWESNPALAELENIMLDWMCNALGLPAHFNFVATNGRGGGCLHSTASEAIFAAVIAARFSALQKLGCYDINGEIVKHPAKDIQKLVAYTSYETHSSTEKAANLAMITIRILQPNEKFELTGEILEKAIQEDVAAGRVPFLVVVSIGSTGGASIDHLMSVGPVAKKYDMWMHVDAAYGGNAFILPENQHLKWGLEYADSIEINPYKMLNSSHEVSCLWLRDIELYRKPHTVPAANHSIDTLEQEPEEDHRHCIDLCNYGVAINRKCRAFRLWILFRTFGLKALREHVRLIMRLAKFFEKLVREDERFEVCNIVELGVVCFRQIPNDDTRQSDDMQSFLTKQNTNLLTRINESRKIRLVPTTLRGEYCLRISVGYQHATEKDIMRAWQLIQSMYVATLDKNAEGVKPKIGDTAKIADNATSQSSPPLDSTRTVKQPDQKILHYIH